MAYLKVPYHIEKYSYNTQFAVSIQADWRSVPLFLHEMKRIDLSINKARVNKSWTTLYMKSKNQEISMDAYNDHIIETLSGKILLDTDPLYNLGLQSNTRIKIYNINTCPYTIIDFSCNDRSGLFCEILEFLTPYNVNILHANCNTVGHIATNIFFITDRNDEKLSDIEIEYLNNIFEYDLKKRIDIQNTY